MNNEELLLKYLLELGIKIEGLKSDIDEIKEENRNLLNRIKHLEWKDRPLTSNRPLTKLGGCTIFKSNKKDISPDIMY